MRSEAGERAGKREERLWRLLDALPTFSSELQLEVVLRRIVDTACEVIGARYGALGVIDENRRGLESFVYRGISDAERERIGRLPVGRGVLGALIDDPRPIRLEHLGEDPRSVGFPANHPPMESFLGVPVASRGHVVGNLYLTEKDGGGPFTEEDERLAIALASQAGVAVENARLYGSATANEVEARRRVRELEVVQEIGTAMLGELDPVRVLRMIVHEAIDLMGASVAYIVMPDDATGGLRVRVAAGRGAGSIEGADLPTTETFSDYAMRLLEPVIVADVDHDQRAQAPIAKQLGQHSMLVAPLVDRRTAVGALILLHPEAGHFSDNDLFVVRRFGALGSMALRNARLIASERDRSQMEGRLLESQLREQLRTDNLHRVIRAQETERARIAREIHDSGGQAMTSILLSLKLAEQLDSVDEIRRQLSELRRFTSGAAADIRRLATELRPSVLDDLGLAAAIERFTSDLRERSGIEIDLSLRLEGPRLGSEIETVVYRIVQEAVNNAVKSADPRRIEIAIDDTSDPITLVVRDDGTGFDPERVAGVGLGLSGMHERAELIDGKLTIDSAPGRGTAVHLEIPQPSGDGERT